jgi:hypothetical protein
MLFSFVGIQMVYDKCHPIYICLQCLCLGHLVSRDLEMQIYYGLLVTHMLWAVRYGDHLIPLLAMAIMVVRLCKHYFLYRVCIFGTPIPVSCHSSTTAPAISTLSRLSNYLHALTLPEYSKLYRIGPDEEEVGKDWPREGGGGCGQWREMRTEQGWSTCCRMCSCQVSFYPTASRFHFVLFRPLSTPLFHVCTLWFGVPQPTCTRSAAHGALLSPFPVVLPSVSYAALFSFGWLGDQVGVLEGRQSRRRSMPSGRVPQGSSLGSKLVPCSPSCLLPSWPPF